MKQNKVYKTGQKKGGQVGRVSETKALLARKRMRQAKLRINGLTMESVGRILNASKSEVSLACSEKLNTPKAVRIRRYIDALPLQSQIVA